jgi:hypothetical protein
MSGVTPVTKRLMRVSRRTDHNVTSREQDNCKSALGVRERHQQAPEAVMGIVSVDVLIVRREITSGNENKAGSVCQLAASTAMSQHHGHGGTSIDIFQTMSIFFGYYSRSPNKV